jgi:hypothetical protein
MKTAIIRCSGSHPWSESQGPCVSANKHVQAKACEYSIRRAFCVAQPDLQRRYKLVMSTCTGSEQVKTQGSLCHSLKHTIYGPLPFATNWAMTNFHFTLQWSLMSLCTRKLAQVLQLAMLVLFHHTALHHIALMSMYQSLGCINLLLNKQLVLRSQQRQESRTALTKCIELPHVHNLHSTALH